MRKNKKRLYRHKAQIRQKKLIVFGIFLFLALIGLLIIKYKYHYSFFS